MTRIFRFRRELISVLIILLLIPSIPALAQDGLPEDQQALVSRVQDALHNAMDSYSSYETSGTWSDHQHSLLENEGTTLRDLAVNTDKTINTTFTNAGDLPRYHFDEQVAYISNFDGSEQRYDLNAQVRIISGVIFVNAEYPNPDPTLPSLPENWTVVNSVDAFPVLELVSITALRRRITSGESVSPFNLGSNFVDAVLADAESAALDSTTLDDGTAVEQITITIGAGGTRAFITGGQTIPSPIESAIYDNLDGTLTLVVSLDADEQIRALNLSLAYQSEVNLHDADASQPEGIVLRVDNSQDITLDVLSINEAVADIPLPREAILQ